jgi:hypothetical protein
MTIPIDSKIDGYPVMSFEKKLEKKLK